jgi:lipopolysaccharide export system permease protein
MADNLTRYIHYAAVPDSIWAKTLATVNKTTKQPAEFIPDSTRQYVYDRSIAVANDMKNLIQFSGYDIADREKNIRLHELEWHRKFSFSAACMVLFFIGAPLGAIIRKGGLGLPIVFAMLVFISFHFINTFGRKLAQEDTITPFLGAWMASLFMTPFAVLLTYRATNDIGIMINFDWITEPFQKLFSKITQNKTN